MALVWVVASGTGGHVFPALAVADILHKKGHKVLWIGTKSGIENKVVRNFNIKAIRAKPMRGKGKLGLLFGCFGLFVSIIQSAILMIYNRPQAVLVMGGYVSAPVGLVASLFRVPLYLHEQNAKAGLANKLLLPFVKIAFTALGEPFTKHLNKIQQVGNPLRENIKNAKIKSVKVNSKLNCLVLGGSQGAQSLNQKVFTAMLSLPVESRPNLWHQVGHINYEYYKSKYDECVKVSDFIDDMSKAYEWADVIISRAGAMTVSECLYMNAKVAWVPYPFAVDDHQTANANYFLSIAQGWVWQESDLDENLLLELWGSTIDSELGVGCVEGDAAELIVSKLQL